LHRNVARAKELLRKVIPDAAGIAACACNEALRNAIVTPSDRISTTTKRRLGLLIGRYVTNSNRER
jgi:5'-methylthioadenosine phosphorylase